MDKEHLISVANTIWQQLFWSVNNPTVWSWGISKKGCGEFQGMATLMLRVSGLIHTGWVFISLNEGKDTYEVRLMDDDRKNCTKMVDDVYCDQVGRIVDELVERPAGMSNNEYGFKAMADSKRKMQ